MIIQFPSGGGTPPSGLPREPEKSSLPAFIERIAQFLRLHVSSQDLQKKKRSWRRKSSRVQGASLSHKIEDIAKFLRRQKNS